MTFDSCWKIGKARSGLQPARASMHSTAERGACSGIIRVLSSRPWTGYLRTTPECFGSAQREGAAWRRLTGKPACSRDTFGLRGGLGLRACAVVPLSTKTGAGCCGSPQSPTAWSDLTVHAACSPDIETILVIRQV